MRSAEGQTYMSGAHFGARLIAKAGKTGPTVSPSGIDLTGAQASGVSNYHEYRGPSQCPSSLSVPIPSFASFTSGIIFDKGRPTPNATFRPCKEIRAAHRKGGNSCVRQAVIDRSPVCAVVGREKDAVALLKIQFPISKQHVFTVCRKRCRRAYRVVLYRIALLLGLPGHCHIVSSISAWPRTGYRPSPYIR